MRERDTAGTRDAPARPSPATVPASSASRVITLQRTAGNRATARLLLRAPYTATVSGESVVVDDKPQEEKAKAIVDEIATKYGISVDSLKGAKATKDHYAKAPAAERAKIAAIPWHFRELVAVKKALDHYAPILGKARKHSTRKGATQEITALGKVNTSITRNTASGVADPNTLGEFYGSDSTFAIYKSSETSTEDFPGDVDRQIEATTTHEIAHGLMTYMIDAFMAASGYWLDQDTKSGKADAEAPPTNYGKTNAREDMAESVMLFFVDEARLKTSCPKRHAAIQAAVDGWAEPIGDFPVPDPNPDMVAV